MIDEVVKALVILAMNKPLKEFVCPLYMRTIEEMAESEDREKAVILRNTASVIERIAILRDESAWIEFMTQEVNPAYKPQQYFQI